MQYNTAKERSTEWACRIVLTVHLFTVVAGYISYLQTKYQLITPVIPANVIEQIASPFWKVSLAEAVLFSLSLWFYFFKKRLVVLILSSISILLFQVGVQMFA